MSMMTPERLREILEQGMACDHLEVNGDGRHFDAVIVSAAFDGLGRIQRHQAVYKVLGDLMVEDVHALQLKTHTPDEWNQQS